MRGAGLLRRGYYELIGYAPALHCFRETCSESFQFLRSDFGFGPIVFEETGYGAVARFENATTVVELHLDWREELILPYVRPGPAHAERSAIAPPGVLLDALIIHRGERPEKQIRVLNPGPMKKAVGEYARTLRVHASEALRGDFRDLTLIRSERPEAPWRTVGRLRP